MEARAIARYIRITPRKARQVVDLIRGKSYQEALAVLKFTPKFASGIIEKVVRSAGANAENNHEMDTDSLYVAEALVDQGPTMKRVEPRARGSANRIRKRTSHITIVLRDKKEG